MSFNRMYLGEKTLRHERRKFRLSCLPIGALASAFVAVAIAGAETGAAKIAATPSSEEPVTTPTILRVEAAWGSNFDDVIDATGYVYDADGALDERLTAGRETVETINIQIDGRTGDDIITGSALNDELIGGLGDDTLIGGAGNDQSLAYEIWSARVLHGGAGIAGLQVLHRAGTLHPRHLQVHDHDVARTMLGQGGKKVGEIGQADDLRLLPPGLPQQVSEAFADQLMIVGDEELHGTNRLQIPKPDISQAFCANRINHCLINIGYPLELV